MIQARKPTPARRHVGAALLVLLLLGGCRELTGGGYRYGRVAVQVSDSAGAPISRARVDLYNARQLLSYGSTGTDGQFLFRFVPRGMLGVRVFPPAGYVPAEGYAAHVDGLVVPQGGILAVDFVFIPATEPEAP